jgi:DNA mismatch repair protein MutS2
VKPLQLLDDASAGVIGLAWLGDAIAPVSPYGERRFAELRPFFAGEELDAQSRAERIATFASALSAEHVERLRFELTELPDAVTAIARASMGDVLTDPAFLELRRFASTIAHIDRILAAARIDERLRNQAVRAVGEALAVGQRDADRFYLDDAFDAELARARAQLAAAQAELDAARGREIERVARGLGRDEVGDEFIVMRDDLRGALPAGVRIVRGAPTYFLCALEYGDATLSALERRDAAAEAVSQCEERVRTSLSAVVQRNGEGLSDAAGALGEFDVILGAARFTRRYACVPAIVAAEPALEFTGARFLPLEGELVAAGRTFTPIDIELDDTAVLTGPNMGGKSVCLLTCGFVALCASFGLPVPAARARIALFDQIAWLGMGREGHVGGLLSSFAQEVLSLKDILARQSPRLLILVDEFARTTTPHEGKALVVALLGRLRERRACGMVATHLEGVAESAGVRHFAVRGLRGIPSPPPTDDIAEALRALAASMDYRVAEVSEADTSRADAIALTALLGLDPQFVDAAYRALSQ